MARLSFKLAAAGAFVLALVQSYSLAPQREIGVLNVSPPTPYIRYFPNAERRGCALVVHGLDASKETMRILSMALADGGFEVYDVDLPGHGDSSVGFSPATAPKAIGNVLDRIGGDCLVVGHSLGAGLLLDVASERHVSKLVLLSPPPTPVTNIKADRILLISGAMDVPRISAFAPVLADVTTDRVEWLNLKWGGHSTAIFRPRYIRHIVEWAGGNGLTTRTGARLLWIGVMVLSALALGVALLPGMAPMQKPDAVSTTLVRYILSGVAAVLILKLVNPVHWLHFFATDYIVGFMLIAGLTMWIYPAQLPVFNSSAILKALAAAAFVILVLGFIAGSDLLHMNLSHGRWWRLPFILAASLPFFLADEVTIRRIYPAWKSVAVALITRALMWAFVVSGVLLLNRQDAFIVLIAHLILFFWVVLWLATHLVHRHTQNPFAAALFAALVQAWGFSAWFVTI